MIRISKAPYYDTYGLFRTFALPGVGILDLIHGFVWFSRSTRGRFIAFIHGFSYFSWSAGGRLPAFVLIH